MSKPALSRYWVFTLNNPEGLLDVDFEDAIAVGTIVFATYQHEVGENGTEHFQGYLELKRTQRRAFVSRLLPEAWLEPRRGTKEQAIAYANKEDSRLDGPWTFGQSAKEGSGARNDLAGVHKLLADGRDFADIISAFPVESLKFSNGIRWAKSILDRPTVRSDIEVVLIYGPTGTGKSTRALEWAEDLKEAFGPYYYKDPNSKWFDGYSGEKVIVFDEFHGSWFPYTTLNRLWDKYPMTVEIKGGSMAFKGTKFIVTSNYLPKEWYAKEAYVPSIQRRISQVIYRPDLDSDWQIFTGKEFFEKFSEKNTIVVS